MTTKTKTNAREQLVEFVLSKGWELDPNRKQWNKRDLRTLSNDRELVQHPTAFRRPAHDGLFWTLELDYTVKSDYSKLDGTRLNRVILKLETADGALKQIGVNRWDDSIVLDHQAADRRGVSLSYQTYLATFGPTGNATLKQRAELIAVDPSLVVWLAAERRETYEAERAAERKRREEAYAARRQPLAISVDRSEWSDLTWELSSAASALRSADGLTDLPQAVRDAEEAIANIRAVLTQPVEAVS